LYAGVDLSQKDAAAEVVERVFKEAGGIDGLVNLAGGFHWDKLEGSGDSPISSDVLVQRAQQSNICNSKNGSQASPMALVDGTAVS
jgi:hypothetical protein